MPSSGEAPIVFRLLSANVLTVPGVSLSDPCYRGLCRKHGCAGSFDHRSRDHGDPGALRFVFWNEIREKHGGQTNYRDGRGRYRWYQILAMGVHGAVFSADKLWFGKFPSYVSRVL